MASINGIQEQKALAETKVDISERGKPERCVRELLLHVGKENWRILIREE